MFCFLPRGTSDCSHPCCNYGCAISALTTFCAIMQLLLLLSEHTCPISWLSCPLFCFRLKEGEDQKEIKIEPADAVEEVEPLPEDYYTRPINLTEGKTLVFCHFLALHFVTWALRKGLWRSSGPKFLVIFMLGLKYWEIHYFFNGNFACSLSFMLYMESSEPEGLKYYFIFLLAFISMCVKHQLLDG